MLPPGGQNVEMSELCVCNWTNGFWHNSFVWVLIVNIIIIVKKKTPLSIPAFLCKSRQICT